MKNVILLTIDTLRKDALGCYGAPIDSSPFIDSIQDKCIRFSKAQSTGPYTQASFPALLTSSYYLDHVLEEKRRKYLSDKRILISEVLQYRGILTAGFHSNAYLWGVFGWNRGWDMFYDSSDLEVTDEVPYIGALALNEKVAEWLGSNADRVAANPLFLWVHYMDVHEPYVPAQEYQQVVDPEMEFSDYEMMSFFRNFLLKRNTSNAAIVEILKKLYMAKVRETDDAVKDLFARLEALGILRDSVIIMTADHGDEFNEHGGLSHDGKMYSELIDVPLIIYDPDLHGGRVSDALVSTIDVSSTIAHLFDIGPIGQFQGRSLLPLEDYDGKGVYGEAIDKHGSSEQGPAKGVFFYREGDLKCIYREIDDSWELYDLKSDPKELNNLIETSADAERMKTLLTPRIQQWTAEEH